MISYLYLGRVGYDEALQLQVELAELRHAGRIENLLLLVEHPPVLTLGRNANRSNILASDALLASRNITLHATNRGGDVTYHGPGQLVGYPIFDLRSLHNPSGTRMGPVDFVRLLEEVLIRLCGSFGLRTGRIAGLTGVWCGLHDLSQDDSRQDADCNSKQERKIAAIGIHVSRGIVTHGFAFNLTTRLDDFTLINPCGITDRAVTSLESELPGFSPFPTLEEAAHATARLFGQLLGEQVLAIESLEALQKLANPAAFYSPEFPAEDTPLQIPATIERLSGIAEHPTRA